MEVAQGFFMLRFVIMLSTQTTRNTVKMTSVVVTQF